MASNRGLKTPYHVIKSVLITEKSTDLADEYSRYSFHVAPKATKPQIKKAVEDLYDVKVASVNTMNMQGKKKRLRTLKYGKRSDWKKAIVTLSEGSIELI